ncbi:cation:proton antiporter [candidate division KSB1 bacterium]
MCLYRVAFGPTPSDRIVANDILGIILVGFCAIYSAVTKEDLYMNIALAWALLSFIGTIALAKYLEGRTYDD